MNHYGAPFIGGASSMMQSFRYFGDILMNLYGIFIGSLPAASVRYVRIQIKPALVSMREGFSLLPATT
jgi:hypothetical protein